MEKGQRLAYQKSLKTILQNRFGELPDELIQRIEAQADIATLEQTLENAWNYKDLSELKEL